MSDTCDECRTPATAFAHDGRYICNRCLLAIEQEEADEARREAAKQARLADEDWQRMLDDHRAGLRPGDHDVVIPQPEHWGQQKAS